MNMFSHSPTRTISLFSLIVLALPLGSLQAQNRSDAPPEKRVQFRVMGMEGFIRDIGFMQGREPIEFNASHTHPTQWMEYRGQGPLYFFNADALRYIQNRQAGDQMPQPVAQFDPPGSGEWLLLLVRDTSSRASGRFRVVPIPEDNDEVSEGIRLYNLTREPLAISINDEQLLLEAGNRRLINPAPDHNNALDMKIGARGESGWKVVSSMMFGHRPNARITYYIVRIDNRIRYKRFVDPVSQTEGPS